jgi:hypothetical protein
MADQVKMEKEKGADKDQGILEAACMRTMKHEDAVDSSIAGTKACTPFPSKPSFELVPVPSDASS